MGTPVAVLAENKEDVEKFKDFKPEGSGEVGQLLEARRRRLRRMSEVQSEKKETLD